MEDNEIRATELRHYTIRVERTGPFVPEGARPPGTQGVPVLVVLSDGDRVSARADHHRKRLFVESDADQERLEKERA